MSIVTRDAASNFLAADSDRQKTFIFNNDFESGALLNASGGELTYPIGTLLGRIAATNKLVPMASGATDGSQFPVGVLAEEVTIADTEEANVNFAVSGDVREGAIVLDGSDTLLTVVSLKTIGDRIKSDTMGIRLVPVTDDTFFDN